MEVIFYLSAAVAIIATALVITQTNAVHGLLYLIVSLLAVAVTFFTLGAPFIAALEVIVYAGAIMVLFVFVVMMLNLGAESTEQERRWLTPQTWEGPAILSAILIIELFYVFAINSTPASIGALAIDPKQVGIALFGPYVLGVELASILLLAGLVGAYHLGRREKVKEAGRGGAPPVASGNGRGREAEIEASQGAARESPREHGHLWR
jgi:NADH-quinone oxidoreductase subunit J